jgi:dTDP-glucose pyrophosphorylase
MRAVVMAGGEGTRLRPLTSNQPKPMVSILGKPCMEHILELLREHGFEDVVVTVAFLPQAIRSYFGDGENLGLNIEYSVEESPLGTAGSVRLGSDRLDDTFLVISGDALCDIDLGKIVEFHKEKGAAVTIGLKSVDNPLEFGIVVTDEDGRVERFLEKPSWGQVFSDTINTGIYVLEPEVLRHIPTDRPYDFSKELFPLLLEMGRPIYGYVCEGYWQDIGNLDQFRQANFDALDEKVRLNVSGLKIRGDGVHRQLLHGVARRLRRPVHGPRPGHDAPRAWPRLAQRDRCVLLHRPERIGRGRDHRPRLRRPRACARARRRCDRGLGDARRPVRDLPGRADLPVQGGRVRRADPREPDLGVARDDARLRQGRRPRPRERRSDTGGGTPLRGGSRHRAEARRARRGEP